MDNDGSDRQSDFGRVEGSALQSAASFLGGTPSAGRGTPAGQRTLLRGRQERDLELWAKEAGCWLDPAKALCGFAPGGEEHRIRRGVSFYAKATHPGRYGFTVIAANGEAALVHALPGEYLQRLLLANRVFDDDIRLVGVVREAAGMALITSQPTIVGTAATREEMNATSAQEGSIPFPVSASGTAALSPSTGIWIGWWHSTSIPPIS